MNTNRDSASKKRERQQEDKDWNEKDWDLAWSLPIEELQERLTKLKYAGRIKNLLKADLVNIYLKLMKQLRESQLQLEAQKKVKRTSSAKKNLEQESDAKQSKKRRRNDIEESDDHDSLLEQIGKSSAAGKHRKLERDNTQEPRSDNNITIGGNNQQRKTSVPAFLRGKGPANDNATAQTQKQLQNQNDNRNGNRNLDNNATNSEESEDNIRLQNQITQQIQQQQNLNNKQRKSWFQNKDELGATINQSVANESLESSRKTNKQILAPRLTKDQAKETIERWNSLHQQPNQQTTQQVRQNQQIQQQRQDQQQQQLNQQQQQQIRMSNSPKRNSQEESSEQLPRGKELESIMRRVSQVGKDLQVQQDETQEWKTKMAKIQKQYIIDQVNQPVPQQQQQINRDEYVPSKKQLNNSKKSIENLTMADINSFQNESHTQSNGPAQIKLSSWAQSNNNPGPQMMKQSSNLIQQHHQTPIFEERNQNLNLNNNSGNAELSDSRSSAYHDAYEQNPQINNQSFNRQSTFQQPSQGLIHINQPGLSRNQSSNQPFTYQPPSHRNSLLSNQNERPSFIRQRVYEESAAARDFNLGVDAREKRNSFQPSTVNKFQDQNDSFNRSQNLTNDGPFQRQSKKIQLPKQILKERRRNESNDDFDDDPRGMRKIIQYSLFQNPCIIFFLIIGIAILTGVLGMKFIVKGPTYCSNTLSSDHKFKIDSAHSCEAFRNDHELYRLCRQYKGCRECPVHGICQDGKFISCEKGYIQEGEKCVEDHEIYQFSNYILRQQFDSIDSIQLLNKIITILNENENTNLFDIHWDPIYMSFNNAKQTKIVEANKDKIRFYAEIPYLTYKQSFILFIRENLLFIIFGISFFIYTSTKNKVGTLTGISQTDILQKYLQLEKKDDGLSRNENTFNSRVWPELERLRKQDKQLQVYERMQFGKFVPVWQLK
ncbi:UNKNOWN [Stylonychia lemnae]|uniref:Man1/Src1 C-terminal domain-containing protein n=1 Tax=Stylonychia lemnae TaxID=5949 RepID=A0A078ARB4_STYLE|nr:UNKNOWN [Stylonychia lemnae]|eukprot:CDW83383.1 UNKNOWN [Stylonychia lemnae]